MAINWNSNRLFWLLTHCQYKNEKYSKLSVTALKCLCKGRFFIVRKNSFSEVDFANRKHLSYTSHAKNNNFTLTKSYDSLLSELLAAAHLRFITTGVPPTSFLFLHNTKTKLFRIMGDAHRPCTLTCCKTSCSIL